MYLGYLFSHEGSVAMNVIRMIKLFGWEPKMNDQISGKRDEELMYIWKRQLLDISNGTLKYA